MLRKSFDLLCQFTKSVIRFFLISKAFIHLPRNRKTILKTKANGYIFYLNLRRILI